MGDTVPRDPVVGLEQLLTGTEQSRTAHVGLRARLAEALIDRGDTDHAAELLLPLRALLWDDLEGTALLAGLLVRTGRIEDAVAFDQFGLAEKTFLVELAAAAAVAEDAPAVDRAATALSDTLDAFPDPSLGLEFLTDAAQSLGKVGAAERAVAILERDHHLGMWHLIEIARHDPSDARLAAARTAVAEHASRSEQLAGYLELVTVLRQRHDEDGAREVTELAHRVSEEAGSDARRGPTALALAVSLAVAGLTEDAERVARDWTATAEEMPHVRRYLGRQLATCGADGLTWAMRFVCSLPPGDPIVAVSSDLLVHALLEAGRTDDGWTVASHSGDPQLQLFAMFELPAESVPRDRIEALLDVETSDPAEQASWWLALAAAAHRHNQSSIAVQLAHAAVELVQRNVPAEVRDAVVVHAGETLAEMDETVAALDLLGQCSDATSRATVAGAVLSRLARAQQDVPEDVVERLEGLFAELPAL